MAYDSPPPLTLRAARLAGKVILVTGASSGIGAAAVRRFAEEGGVVVGAARRVERIETLANELAGEGHAVSAVACDVRDEASVQAAVAEVVARHGRLDGAFNNAGVGGAHVPFAELSADAFDRCIATNLRGVFLSMKHEIPAMLAAGGGRSSTRPRSAGWWAGRATATTRPASGGWPASPSAWRWSMRARGCG
ncbi:MAG: hypothetical protein JWP50_1291 [Phenylobacterium sp.]|nr:hypothetical protein [Phenylobacterium sp.]